MSRFNTTEKASWPELLVDLREFAGVRIPDSRSTREAEELCREVSGWMLYAHSARSYLFAALLARRGRERVDEEALYVGCLLHDLGLTPAHRDPIQAFERVSADRAAEFVERRAWSGPRRDTVHRAIAMHMAFEIPDAEAAEVRLLEAGVACDCAGRGREQLSAAEEKAIMGRLPRGRFKTEFPALLSAEAEAKPETAAGRFVEAGLLETIRACPFADTDEHGQGSGDASEARSAPQPG